MKKLFSILSIITLLLTSSAIVFAAVGDNTPTKPTYSIAGLFDSFKDIDSIATAVDVSLAVPHGWNASMVSDEYGEHVLVISNNGYEIHMDVSYDRYLDAAYTMPEPIADIIEADSKAVVGMDELYFVQTSDGMIWIANSGLVPVPINDNSVVKDRYFYPQFTTPENHTACLYGFQGPYVDKKQCQDDAKVAQKIIKGLGAIDYE